MAYQTLEGVLDSYKKVYEYGGAEEDQGEARANAPGDSNGGMPIPPTAVR
eukprot:CAMPEP_0114592592 /NCGR_PEP_ID=MMETSP0125-20121206/14380_1 /TAXON_ID=485358 ORGANISM="Aristerostoma sp., Strain ATCC 50986" /NCGR_SAMPLE_ID=MMETSP0125 /ASSEMBLY_ACC=CAM_ASM_000245 /LENGTH=49 /DNA_ID=CAMNT_0001791313 /DNA_START=2083 /DNA_END=2232 /DNA_ORIENTATION=+